MLKFAPFSFKLWTSSLTFVYLLFVEMIVLIIYNCPFHAFLVVCRLLALHFRVFLGVDRYLRFSNFWFVRTIGGLHLSFNYGHGVFKDSFHCTAPFKVLERRDGKIKKKYLCRFYMVGMRNYGKMIIDYPLSYK